MFFILGVIIFFVLVGKGMEKNSGFLSFLGVALAILCLMIQLLKNWLIVAMVF